MNLTNSVKRLSLLAIVSIMSLVSFAQSQITGHVRDKSGEPIVGASILIKGTGTGTVTDIEGAFTVAKASPSDVLIVSSIGYSTENVKVGNQTRINVVLNEDMANLDEVVVIGYGTMKRRDLTGSVSSVNNEALTANPTWLRLSRASWPVCRCCHRTAARERQCLSVCVAAAPYHSQTTLSLSSTDSL